MTIPGIVSACMMTFMPTMSSYVIASKLSERKTQIIGSIINDYMNERLTPLSNNIGSALALVMLMIVGISLLIEKSLTRKDDTKKGGIW